MSRFCLVLSILAALQLLASVNGQQRRIQFSELSCLNHDDNICGELKCGLSDPHSKNRNKQKYKLFNLGCRLRESTTEINWRMRVIYENDDIKPYTLQITGDYCDIVNGRIDTGAIQRVALPLIKRFIPSASHPCPYNNEVIEVHNFDGNDIMQLLPRHLSPFGNYTVDIQVLNDKKQQIIHTFGKFAIVKNKEVKNEAKL